MFVSDFTGDTMADALCVPRSNASRSLAAGDRAGTIMVSDILHIVQVRN